MKKSLGASSRMIPTPVWVVGTYDKDSRPNAATIAWGGVCCSDPPCLNVSLRAATMTHGNLVARGAFTVSVPSVEQVAEVDYLGIASGRDVNKLKTLELTAVRSELVDAPLVAEFPLVAECRLTKTVELGLHTLFVGEILDIKAEESLLENDSVRLERARPFIFDPYHGQYREVGEVVGQAFSIGRRFEPPSA